MHMQQKRKGENFGDCIDIAPAVLSANYKEKVSTMIFAPFSALSGSGILGRGCSTEN